MHKSLHYLEEKITYTDRVITAFQISYVTFSIVAYQQTHFSFQNMWGHSWGWFSCLYFLKALLQPCNKLFIDLPDRNFTITINMQ